MLGLGACDRIADKGADNKPSATAQSDAASEAGNNAGNVANSADELNWARAALQRNPTLELVATDTQTGVFTVRIKSTGETRIVKLSELAAGPAELMAAASSETPAYETATPAVTSAAAITPATEVPQVAPPAATAATATPTANTKGYTIERSAGQTRISGPGVSIVSTGVTATTDQNTGQREVDPTICEGHRMLHFDSRSIYVNGDAIVARGGCELYITNSHIVAAGTGLVVHDAVVHISNSTIAGNTASFDADDEAKLYLRGSTFQGLPRRGEKTVVQDQGGNRWR
jgi:hypothetical protein